MDQSRAPYLEALAAHAARHPGRYHVPGHKGGPGADRALLDALGPAPFDHDIPALTYGIDVGVEPTPFQLAQELAADAWGAKRSWFLINGASHGNLAACLALRHRGPRVVFQRNVHSSTIDGMILAGLEPTFVAPVLDPELHIAHCLTAESLNAALDAQPEAVGALVVSPTYFGAVADVRALVEVAHAHDVPLVVDESWGAHLRFSGRLPESALVCGADVVISSVHKIVGSLTQSAILHVGRDALLDADFVDRCVTLTESTSPSSLLTASLDAARRQAATNGEMLMAETIDALAETRELIREIPGLDVLDERLAGRPGVHGWDPLRLAIDVRGTGTSGHRLAALLRDRDDIHFELSSQHAVVAIFGLGEHAAESARSLVAALRSAVEAIGVEERASTEKFAPPPPWGPLEMAPRDAFFSPQDVIPLTDAVERVAAESLATYPPGIPNVLPGERLTAETIGYIRETVGQGGLVRGAADRTLETIRVVAQ